MAKILYFAGLVNQLDRASEEADLPESVRDVRSLLAWLRQRGGKWERLLTDDSVRVTVDRQFAVPETPITNANEIALINTRSL
jgi:sulfur-carrier protein